MLKRELKSKKAKFYHSINFTDFREYCRQRAILSRDLLAKSLAEYTIFFSDNADKKLGVWERVFGNLNDFGQYFWKFERAVPNAYGTITIILGEGCWDSFSDINITKKTITAKESEVLSATQIDDAFECVDNVYRLKKGFTGAEVSVSNSCISLDCLANILVDPLTVADKTLREHVLSVLEKTECLDKIVTERQVIEREIFCKPQKSRIEHLLTWSRMLEGRLIHKNEPLQKTLPSELAEWFESLEEWKKRILASWLTYTFNGTLRCFS